MGVRYLYYEIYSALNTHMCSGHDCKGIAMEPLDQFFNYMTIMEVLNLYPANVEYKVSF